MMIKREKEVLNERLDIFQSRIEEIRDVLELTEAQNFSMTDVVYSFFGSLMFGLIFIYKEVALNLASVHTIFNSFILILFTIFVLSAEIYYIGYSRVSDKTIKPFFSFWWKRLLVFYSVAIIMAFLLVFILGIYLLPVIQNSSINFFKLIILVSFPCALGASVADLFRKL